MAEAVSARIEPRPRAAPRAPVSRPLRPWLREGRTLAEWLDSLEDDPPPGEDMLPMNAPHAAAMRHAANVLEHRYRGRRAEVGFDLPVVFRLPDERGRLVAGRLSPDVFVALGAERDERRDEYDATVLPPPDFVLEVLSKSTWKRDEGPKLDAYALLGVRECFLFDATGRRAAPALRGFALSPAGARPLPEVRLADVSRGVPSAVLGLVAHVSARPTPSRGDGVPALALRWRDMETGRICAHTRRKPWPARPPRADASWRNNSSNGPNTHANGPNTHANERNTRATAPTTLARLRNGNAMKWCVGIGNSRRWCAGCATANNTRCGAGARRVCEA